MLEIESFFYGLKAKTIHRLLTESPIRKKSEEPKSFDYRYITKNVPFGLVPISELAK